MKQANQIITIQEEKIMARTKATDANQTPEKKAPAKKVYKLPHTNLTTDDKERATVVMEDEAKMALADFDKITKELKCSMITCSTSDIRFCVQSYYQLQDLRIALGGQLRSIEQSASAGSDVGSAPQAQVLQWLFNNILGLETEVKKALDIWSDSNEVASWCKKVMGIGPVLSAGLVVYFDITKAPSVSHFYSYSGLNNNNDPMLGKEAARKLVNKHVKGPGVTNDELIALASDPECTRSIAKLSKYAYDEKKDKYTKEALIKGLSKPPYNKELRCLLWKVGEAFVKVSNKPASLYGRLYKERKLLETTRNANHEYADQALEKLTKFNIGKNTKSYKQYAEGILPEAHIHARATRYAVRMFVSHLYEEMYRVHYNAEAPRNYVFVYREHSDYIGPEVPFKNLDPNKPSRTPANPVKIY